MKLDLCADTSHCQWDWSNLWATMITTGNFFPKLNHHHLYARSSIVKYFFHVFFSPLRSLSNSEREYLKSLLYKNQTAITTSAAAIRIKNYLFFFWRKFSILIDFHLLIQQRSIVPLHKFVSNVNDAVNDKGYGRIQFNLQLVLCIEMSLNFL